MPVNIYIATPQGGTSNRVVARLCIGEWTLQPQVEALAVWLEENAPELKPADYVADIGFSPRQCASGGGPVLAPEMFRRMADLGMSVYLSEYSAADD